MTWTGPTFPEILTKLLKEAIINQAQYDQCFANYEHVKKNWKMLQNLHSGEWVASCDGVFYYAPNYAELTALMDGVSGGDQSFMLQIIGDMPL